MKYVYLILILHLIIHGVNLSWWCSYIPIHVLHREINVSINVGKVCHLSPSLGNAAWSSLLWHSPHSFSGWFGLMLEYMKCPGSTCTSMNDATANQTPLVVGPCWVLPPPLRCPNSLYLFVFHGPGTAFTLILQTRRPIPIRIF